MVIVAVLIPPLMLGALLALARYEERMFGDPGAVRKRGRHLHAVPKGSTKALPPRLTPHTEHGPAARHRRRPRDAA
ncbi:hypothetical protein [Streptomyces sp. NPDC059991]|uniref:hypothetical protein n=1 Tax=unclassified Streptomyces TaxID=2593676 RepID=UPI00369AD2CF